MRSLHLLWRLAYIFSALTFVVAVNGTTQCQPWTVSKKNRVFILTDIANEPDDTMSLVRLLTHSDLYDIQGLVAITSFWLPNATHPEQIQNLVNAYGTVRENLQSHSNSKFPTKEDLSSVIKSGPIVYGTQALYALEKGGNLTEGAKLLLDKVDASSEPLYVQIWGGSNTLATALWYVNRTRSPSDLEAFTCKIRAYSISDQDDTGIWIRRNFANMRYIASRHGFNQYSNAAWTGISTLNIDIGGPNTEIVSQEWLTKNIQIGPLGSHYPNIAFIMEGDTPSLLYNIPNGLGDPEHPEWGSWGGRYTPDPLDGNSQYGDAADQVTGLNGQMFQTNKATIWRWREAFQNEFAARIRWTLGPNNGSDADTTHPPVVVVNDSCGFSALHYNVFAGDAITLSTKGTYSPDTNAQLNYTWFQYRESSAYQNNPAVVPTINFTYPANSGESVSFKIPYPESGKCVRPEDVTEFGSYGEMQKCSIYHVIVAVKDLSKKYPITRYRRIILETQPYDNSTQKRF